MAIREFISEKSKILLRRLHKKTKITLSDYLKENLISFFSFSSRDEALFHLVSLLKQNHFIPSEELFFQAILEREKIVSTGIGMGVAIPHAKMKEVTDFCLAIGIQKDKGLEWDALDAAPVKLVFMIGGPENRQTDYLNLLSQITNIIKDENIRKNLLQQTSKGKVFKLLNSSFSYEK